MDLADLFMMLKDTPPLEPEPEPARPDGKIDLTAVFRTGVLAFVKASNDEGGRYKDYLRGSGLSSVCGRREGIFLLNPHLRGEAKRTAGGVMTVDWGHMLHEWWQNRYLGPMGWLLGRWACTRCLTVTAGTMPENCPGCSGGRHSWVEYLDDKGITRRELIDTIKFVEMFVCDDELRYSGHPDGLLKMPGLPTGYQVLFELKSIKTDNYDRLKKPLPEHEIQVHGYMRPLGVTDALVVYVDKGKQCPWKIRAGGFVSGPARIKVFHVPFNDEFWEVTAKRIRDHWRARSGEDPRSIIRLCKSPSAQFARFCVAREICFSFREDGT